MLGTPHVERAGLLLLRGIGAVAPVPRPEDIGIDAIATLLRPLGSTRLIAEDSFYVQLKSSSIRSLFYEGDEVDWLVNLQLPLFIGSVDLGASSISLYSTHRLSSILIEHRYAKIGLFLDTVDEGGGNSGERYGNCGPPVLKWAVSDLARPDFPAHAYSVLKPFITAELRNIHHRPIRYLEPIYWETNQPPVCGRTFQAFGSIRDDSRMRANLEAMKPHLHALAMDLFAHRARDEMGLVLAFIAFMRSYGIDPDPDNILLTLVAHVPLWEQPNSS
jgi:hypothetical protein